MRYLQVHAIITQGILRLRFPSENKNKEGVMKEV